MALTVLDAHLELVAKDIVRVATLLLAGVAATTAVRVTIAVLARDWDALPALAATALGASVVTAPFGNIVVRSRARGVRPVRVGRR